MQIADVRRALAEAVRRGVTSRPKLHCFGYVPDSIVEPCFFVAEVEIDVHNSFGSGHDVAKFTCRVLVSRADDRTGQQRLDRFLSRAGPASIRAAILAPTAYGAGAPGQLALSGTADDVSVERIGGYRYYDIGAQKFYGAELHVKVVGSGG